MKPISFTLDIKTVSEANVREHWRKRADRTREHRFVAYLATIVALRAAGYAAGNGVRPALQKPIVVTLTRIGPRKLDSDNLAGSAKHARDGIADALGINDGDDQQAVWVYGPQRSGPVGGPRGGKYAVEVLIECPAAPISTPEKKIG